MRETNVNRAITLPRLSSGVTPKAMGMCWGSSAFVAVLVSTSASAWYALIPLAVGAIIHAILKWAYKKDHRIFEIYTKYSLLANEYHPHVRENLTIHFSRPNKVGKGVRI